MLLSYQHCEAAAVSSSPSWIDLTSVDFFFFFYCSGVNTTCGQEEKKKGGGIESFVAHCRNRLTIYAPVSISDICSSPSLLLLYPSSLLVSAWMDNMGGDYWS